MNKSSFLSLVRQASNISDQDVEELEKLVVNFPYCQTAHLLIAKAAYDKGSMLSNQKLKKAAIYAANRQLLKKLIHTSDATVALQPVAEKTVPEIAEKPIPVEEPAAPAPAIPEVVAEPIQEIPTEQPEPGITAIVTEPEISGQKETAEPELALEQEIIRAEAEEIAAEPAAVTALPEDEAIETSEIPAEEALPAEFTTEEFKEKAVAEETVAEETPEIAATAEPDYFALPFTEVQQAALQPVTTGIAVTEITSPDLYEDEVIAQEILESETIVIEIPEPALSEQPIPSETYQAALPETTLIKEETLPDLVVAEAPEAETDESDFVFGAEFIADPATSLNNVPDVHELLLENAPEALNLSSPQQIPEAQLQETLAGFDKYLFKPEKEAEIPEPETDLKVVYAQNEIDAIYERDSIGYWMSSSRLGESLELKNELTAETPTDFHPELILEYSKTHTLHREIKPATSNLSRQLEIIDEFLKMTPRLKSMANTKIKTEAQEDLSIKSSKISKNLATESLANIMIKQGKIKKAIKIYEHLILKIPEKKPYFVAQIEKLQNME